MRLIVSLIVTIILAVLVGAAMALLDTLGFYLIIAFPAIGGAIIGFGAALPHLSRKLGRSVSSDLGTSLSSSVIVDDRPSRSSLLIVVLVGVLIAQAVYWAGIYVGVLFEEYPLYQTDFLNFINEEVPGISEEEALQQIAEFETEETGMTGFPAFLKLSLDDETTNFSAFVTTYAEHGVTITRGSSSTGILLQGAMAYGLWIIEALIMLGVAVSTAFGRARAIPEPEPAAATT
jgi:hypothetical protein